jgi:hypothetical protein
VQPGRQWEAIENKQVIVETMARNRITAHTLWFGRHGKRSNKLRDQAWLVTREVFTQLTGWQFRQSGAWLESGPQLADTQSSGH